MMAKVIIVGAGINGLATAVRLMEMSAAPLSVIIYAEDIPGTTSVHAAGVWTPYSLQSTEVSLVMRWAKETYDMANEMYEQHSVDKIGIYPTTVVDLSYNKESKMSEYATIYSNFRKLTDSELEEYGNWGTGYIYDAFIIEGHMFMEYLMNRFASMGGVIQQRKVSNLADLFPEKATVIINCAGLNGGEICGDETCFPVRGQIMRVEAPWIKQTYFNRNGSYIIPRRDFVVLGGTTQKDDWSENIDPMDSDSILERCYQMVPSLKGAKVLSEWAGLRPCRSEGVRLEKEYIHDTPVIHNYGHGGSGLTLFWGCAKDVATLALHEIQSNL